MAQQEGGHSSYTEKKIRHRACAQACKSVLVTLREVTSNFNVLVIFFDFNAFGGSRIPRARLRALTPPQGPPKINIFCPESTKNQYFRARSTKN